MNKKQCPTHRDKGRTENTRNNDIRKLAIDLGLFDMDLAPEPLILDRLAEVLDQLPEQESQRVIQALQSATDVSGRDSNAFITKHGISKTEARLLINLSQGKTVVQYADDADVSINTARTHMRRLLEKTGATGQLDLVRMYLL